jgi:HD-GYP domain-containing protein (c-di-GMP phosphodiesterase class II)
MEERDPYTAGHSRRVRRYALRLGDALGLTGVERRHLSLAAKLHDIGKAGVPEAILHKQGRLNAAEDRIIKEHPVIGERILSPIIRSRTVLASIRAHHERLDGNGYPDGLVGDAIPLLARVVSIADCFDALTTSRPYRESLPAEVALDHIRAGAGTKFEPEFVRAFIEVMGTKSLVRA